MSRALETSRRSLLGGGMAAVALAVPGVAAAKLPVDRSAWETALRAYNRLLAEDAAFTPHWLAVGERCDAECNAVPHTTLRPCAYTGSTRPVSTADRQFVFTARNTLEKIAEGKMRWDDTPSLNEHLDLLRDTVAAADEREAKLKAIRARYGMDALDDKAEEFGERIADFQTKLLAMPAPDLAALHWKLLELREPDGSMVPWAEHVTEQVYADIARLMPGVR